MYIPKDITAYNNVFDAWSNGYQNVAINLPANTGKEFALAMIATKLVNDGKRVLILAHQDTTKTGVNAKLAYMEITDNPNCIVSTMKCFCTRRNLAEYDANRFDVILIDEASRFPMMRSLGMLKRFGSANTLSLASKTVHLTMLRNYGFSYIPC